MNSYLCFYANWCVWLSWFSTEPSFMVRILRHVQMHMLVLGGKWISLSIKWLCIWHESGVLGLSRIIGNTYLEWAWNKPLWKTEVWLVLQYMFSGSSYLMWGMLPMRKRIRIVDWCSYLLQFVVTEWFVIRLVYL